jgi:DNA-binding transcriptional regulator YdaS (Cro superfamily)
MKLIDYLKSLSADERESLARRCNTSVDYLLQIGHGKRTPKAVLAIAIERETAAAVRCDELMPEVDWDYLRRSAKAAAVTAR